MCWNVPFTVFDSNDKNKNYKPNLNENGSKDLMDGREAKIWLSE